jgi:PAS domain S-box-containing protein
MPDNTEGPQSRAELQESEERFRFLFDRSPAGMNIADQNGCFLRVNRAFCEFLGRTESELLTLSHRDVIHPDEMAEVVENMARGGVRDSVRRFIRKDGSTVWGYISAELITPPGRAAYWIAVIQDITAHTKAEERVHREWDLLRVVANENPAYLWMASAKPPYRNSFVNRAFAAFLGIDGNELGENWPEYVHPDDRPQVVEGFMRSAARGPSGELRGFSGSVVDITELREAEEQVRRLSERLIRAHEDERGRIARELHDDLGQQIASLGMLLSGIKGEIPEERPVLRAKLEGVHSRLTEVASVVRSISHQLHPAALEYAGLSAAVRGLCKEFKTLTGVEAQFASEELFRDVPVAVGLSLYRVAQEALQNVAKHARTKRAEVLLRRTDGSLEMVVKDSGRGFDLKSRDKEGGLGLISMRERLRAAGGTLKIESVPGAGTRLTARIPLNQPAMENAVAVGS